MCNCEHVIVQHVVSLFFQLQTIERTVKIKTSVVCPQLSVNICICGE